MQKTGKQARLSTPPQTRQRSWQELGRCSLPVPEYAAPAEPRCACTSPVLMWEGEYFCIATGDLGGQWSSDREKKTQRRDDEMSVSDYIMMVILVLAVSILRFKNWVSPQVTIESCLGKAADVCRTSRRPCCDSLAALSKPSQRNIAGYPSNSSTALAGRKRQNHVPETLGA